MHAALVFPHQLFENPPSIAPGCPVYLIEDPLFFGNDPRWPTRVHRQKLALHRASMKAHAAELEAAGHRVHYLDAPEGSAIDSAEHLDRSLPAGITRFHLTDPADHFLEKRVRRFAESRRAGLTVHPSPNFLSPPDFLTTHLASARKPFMAKFYEAQRKRMRVLVDGDLRPIGGKWSYDTENRRKLPAKYQPPAEPFVTPDAHVREAIKYVSRRFPENPGSLDSFRWPVTRTAASRWLDDFLDRRFAGFGTYEDAISTRHATLCHAAITPALNIGLLDPADVVRRALARAEAGDIPMNSLEGFIRQIVGWREFMHGLYQHRGTTIRTGNFWDHRRPLSAAFYDGSTGIPPVDRVIRQVLSDGWCHHIERLMVLGNFMLLCRIRPDDVYRWFMELFVDSCDWVMVPNVYGMSQFADGGTFTTKPYISGSNYILKMSDEKKGSWCEIWDGLFWSFIADHTDFFLRNPRLSMMARSWMKMPPARQSAHLDHSSRFLESLSA